MIELVDLLDGFLDLATVNGITNLDSLLYGLNILCCGNVGLESEFPSRRGVTLIDQVIHDHELDVTAIQVTISSHSLARGIQSIKAVIRKWVYQKDKLTYFPHYE